MKPAVLSKTEKNRVKESPIYVLCGFLGSGKTTLLIRLLSHFLDRGIRPSVLMNEFGEIDIDGKLVEKAGPRAKNLALKKSWAVACVVTRKKGWKRLWSN
jgi:molybdopterin-guanine dinucleotide biosynthesis protein